MTAPCHRALHPSTTTDTQAERANNAMLQDLSALRERIGESHFDLRIQLQPRCGLQRLSVGKSHIHWQDTELPLALARRAFKISGPHERVRQNTLRYDIARSAPAFEFLPRRFDGLRILQLSDLHIDGGERLREVVGELDYDLCVITGDYRFDVSGPIVESMNRLQYVLEAVDCEFGTLAILGNHDWLEIVPCIEEMGARVLLNESVALRSGDAELWIAGVDDNHYYGCDDMTRALEGVPDDAFRILLAHSPASSAEAAANGFDLYLAGHTHGGQTCLPFGLPIIRNAKCPRRHLAGAWQVGSMQG